MRISPGRLNNTFAIGIPTIEYPAEILPRPARQDDNSKIYLPLLISATSVSMATSRVT